ncbi:MAG: alpha/beta hydrolase [Phycisphaeraceae bacterium]|nr:alpha/beta hydrolase [Phycisphaeraceae bacterium]
MRLAFFVLLVGALVASAQTAGTPKTEPLWPDGTPNRLKNAGKEIAKPGWVRSVHEPTLRIYRPKKQVATRPALVICPGGGYGGLAIDHEGKQVAEWFNGLGGTAFVLKYRHAPYKHPTPLNDLQRAIRTVRHRAEEYNINPKKIGVIGFSAGGHLASTAATHFDAGDPDAKDPIERAGSRPDFAILIYPVISMRKGVTHAGSRKNLLGANPPEKLVADLSNAEQVTDRTPPTFLVHSIPDRVVKIQNSRQFHEACQKAGVESQLLVYKTGGHGYGLGGRGKAYSLWPKRCAEWLSKLGVLKAH